ncbi:neutral zinc metallopeptidase [Kribbella deserti]|uniref:Neutral zinc metallopeptidase n=1 Tax=Kribbella deserti TaxID=1926257 RepID=A0ABV6QDK6_9ACTN
MTRFWPAALAAVAMVATACGAAEPSGSADTPTATAPSPTEMATPTPSPVAPTSIPTPTSINTPTSFNTPTVVPTPTASRTTWSPTVSGPVRNDPLLGSNPIHLEQGYGISAVNCRLPAWKLQVAAAKAYYSAAIACHDRAWRGTLAHFGLTLTSPRLWAGARGNQYAGGCGSNDTGREAFYCSVDETIVMPFDTMRSIARYGEGYALAVLSHEYGHHLQQQAGIFDAYVARGRAVGYSSQAGQLLSRQLELQAWCFSGMFYGTNTGRGSITRSLSRQALDNNSHAGDRPGELRQHGTNRNIANWFKWGRHPSMDPSARVSPSVYECNPWAARDNGWLQ